MNEWLLSVVLFTTTQNPHPITTLRVETVRLASPTSCLITGLYVRKALIDLHGEGTIVIMDCTHVQDV